MLKFKKDKKVLHVKEKDKRFIEYLKKNGFVEVKETKTKK